MLEESLDALVTAADDGITFDDLDVTPADGAYTVSVDGETATATTDAELRDAVTNHPDHVTNWYFWHAVAPQKQDRWSFLRWLEGANEHGVADRYERLESGVVETWGQLRIEVTLVDADGNRRYSLRHEEDAGVPDEELAIHSDPLDAREIAKHDDEGRYRPLKTAPSLQTGWQFPDLTADQVVSAVDSFYPATVSNWHREREGELDISHWHETVERQTGIYGVVQTWDRGEGHDHVNWVAEACCDDSQCLKRREWQYDEETDLEVDGGDGTFPCREPCSLVISAARKWTKLEGEQSRAYEFELTPSEKEQVEAIIDAVAEGRTDEIREADIYDDANRYRTRFLRAKLFDNEGNLCGVETERDQ